MAAVSGPSSSQAASIGERTLAAANASGKPAQPDAAPISTASMLSPARRAPPGRR
jgi:hypothetical protein